MKALISIFCLFLVLYASVTALLIPARKRHERTLSDTRFLNNK